MIWEHCIERNWFGSTLLLRQCQLHKCTNVQRFNLMSLHCSLLDGKMLAMSLYLVMYTKLTLHRQIGMDSCREPGRASIAVYFLVANVIIWNIVVHYSASVCDLRHMHPIYRSLNELHSVFIRSKCSFVQYLLTVSRLNVSPMTNLKNFAIKFKKFVCSKITFMCISILSCIEL